MKCFQKKKRVASRANINSKHRALIALIIVTSHFLLSWIHSTVSHLLTWSYTAAGHQGAHTSLKFRLIKKNIQKFENFTTICIHIIWSVIK